MKSYKGSCHCGNVTYEVKGEFVEGMSCNCSICSRAGWVLLFVPEKDFELLTGADATVDYQFGKEQVHHPFCATCGVRSFGYGSSPEGTMYSVNARCLEGVEIEDLTVNAFDGAAL